MGRRYKRQRAINSSAHAKFHSAVAADEHAVHTLIGVADKVVVKPDGGPGAAPWVLVGIGGAAVVGAVVFGLMAQGTNEDFDAESDIALKKELESDGKAQALTSDLLGVGGGLLVAGGLIWYFAASGEEPAPRTTVELPPVRPMLTRDGFGIAFGGTL